MKLKDLKVSLLRKLGPKDILIIQHNGSFGQKTRKGLAHFAGYLRKSFDWQGVIVELGPDQKLTRLNEKSALSLYNILRERFEEEKTE